MQVNTTADWELLCLSGDIYNDKKRGFVNSLSEIFLIYCFLTNFNWIELN